VITAARPGGPMNQERRIATELPPIVIANDDGALTFNHEPAVLPPPMQQQR